MSNQTKSQPWWHRTDVETLGDRVKKVQNVNDPTIMSDDILRASKVVMWALLAFTTLLSAAGYFKFFERSFGFNLALIMAVLLACVIEFGKNWGGLRVLRIPFFLGWSHIWATVQNTVLWAGLLVLACVTFAASVYNSTKGAEQLSLLLSHERHAVTFAPDVADIDRQIEATEGRMAENRKTKWKGTMTWEAQRANRREAAVLEGLQRQRETRIQQQRVDFEKESGIRDGQNQFTASNLLAVGGWVELLQIILMFIRVSAERSLDRTAGERSASGNGHNIPHPTANGHSNPRAFQNQNTPGPIGFYWSGYGQAPATPPQNTVSQLSQTVSQTNGAENTSYADDTLKLAMKRIQGHFANFDGQHRNNATVAGNIHTILDETLEKMRPTSFVPTYDCTLKFYDYVAGLFPALGVKGWPYDKSGIFLQYVLRPHKSQTLA